MLEIKIKGPLSLEELQKELDLYGGSETGIHFVILRNLFGEGSITMSKQGVVRGHWHCRLKDGERMPGDGLPRGESEYFDISIYPLQNQ